MARTGPTPALVALLAALAGGCHGFAFGDRTTQEDKDLNNFAEARNRAATYYDGGDYVRAALQYEEALNYRPDHVPTRLGYAYSLTYSKHPGNLQLAETELEAIGTLSDPAEEVKRVYGLGMNQRALAALFDRRARAQRRKGLEQQAEKSRERARRHAKAGLEYFRQVFELDRALADRKILAPMRVSASLTPDAHVGMAHCEILLAEFDPENPQQLSRHLARARSHILSFAKVAEQARRFWEKRRERLLVTDPMHEEGTPGAGTIDPREKKRYEARIFSTIRQEVRMRTALLLTLLYVNRYREAIDEATKILEKDPAQHEVLMLRGNAYAFLDPPNYTAAVRDLKAYRRTRDVTKLTDELVRVNLRIRKYEKLAEKQKQQKKKAEDAG